MTNAPPPVTIMLSIVRIFISHSPYQTSTLDWSDLVLRLAIPTLSVQYTVHHMALAGKELVGWWFGPSTVDGTIKCVNDNALIIHSVVDLSSEPLSTRTTTFQKHRLAYLLLLTARSFRPMCTQSPTHKSAHLDSASSQDRARCSGTQLRNMSSRAPWAIIQSNCGTLACQNLHAPYSQATGTSSNVLRLTRRVNYS